MSLKLGRGDFHPTTERKRSMPAGIRKIVFAAMLGLTTLVSTLYVRNAEALWPLSFEWGCEPDSPTQVICYFLVTSPVPPVRYRYQWFFGDGAQTDRLASTEAEHVYAIATGEGDVPFTVTLVGYSSPTAMSPDNFI